MKVLIINTFAEGTSTAKIATGLYQQLIEDGHECRLLYGAGEDCANKDFHRIATDFDLKLHWFFNQITGIHGGFSLFSMKRVFKEIEEFRPDVVQLFNLHYYYLDIAELFSYLKRKKLPIVYSMLDEYPYLGYCCYAYDCDQYITGCKYCDYKRFKKEYPRNIFRNGAPKTVALKKKAYADYKSLVFTGPKWVLERAAESYLLKGKRLVEIDEFIDTDNVFVPRKTDKLSESLGIPDGNKVILNVASSSDPRKGVTFYLKVAELCQKENITFIHVGYQGDVDNVPKNFIPIPFVKDQNILSEYYSIADLFVCTSLADTMPNVCLDAMSCGTPVAGFDITGVPYVAKEPIGTFVKAKDVRALAEVCMNVKRKTEDTIKECREYALSRYSPRVFYKKVKQIYDDLLSERD